MFPLSKLLLIVGALLAVVGSFLPWVMTGDVVSYQIFGLVMWFDSLFLYHDNGGLLIVIVSILVLGVALSRPFRHQKVAIMISALCLVVVVAYQWVAFVVNKLGSAGVIGAPEPLIGFGLIALGAILVLVAAVWMYQIHPRTVEL